MALTREEQFRRYQGEKEPYNAAIEAAGDLPWFRDPEKLTRLESQLPGITQMTEDDRRRALYDRHHHPRGNAR